MCVGVLCHYKPWLILEPRTTFWTRSWLNNWPVPTKSWRAPFRPSSQWRGVHKVTYKSFTVTLAVSGTPYWGTLLSPAFLFSNNGGVWTPLTEAAQSPHWFVGWEDPGLEPLLPFCVPQVLPTYCFSSLFFQRSGAPPLTWPQFPRFTMITMRLAKIEPCLSLLIGHMIVILNFCLVQPFPLVDCTTCTLSSCWDNLTLHLSPWCWVLFCWKGFHAPSLHWFWWLKQDHNQE